MNHFFAGGMKLGGKSLMKKACVINKEGGLLKRKKKKVAIGRVKKNRVILIEIHFF